MSEALEYGKRHMILYNQVPPTLFVEGLEGEHFFLPKNMNAPKGLEAFADNARLFCLSYGAKAAVFASSGRMNITEKLGNSEHSSEIISPKEVVILMGETRDNWEQWIFMVDRDDKGTYAGLVRSPGSHSEMLKGYFGQFLTTDVPGEAMREEAKHLLQLNGIFSENTPEQKRVFGQARF